MCFCIFDRLLVSALPLEIQLSRGIQPATCATNTNFIVFGLTRPGFESTIYHTQDKHATHYATDEVLVYMVFNATFNIISVILWRSVLLPIGEGNRRQPPTCHKSLTSFIT